MKLTLKRLSLAIAGAGLLTIYGCGGGSSTAAPDTTTTAATTTNVPITVVDGPIQNATVCLDKNSNGVCDSGEPFAKTDATGKVNLTVELADAGKYPVIAVVGIDAIDADTGAVPVPFTMSAPADSVGVVSPLTTLVQQTIASTGASTADAAKAVQAATGINVSLFQDFTKVAAPTDGSISAATVARMVVVTTQQQSTAIGNTVVGTKADDGATITQADINKAIQKKLLELLPALVAAMSDSTVQAAATPAAKEAALLAAANTLVTSSGLTTASMATVVAINAQASSTAPVASVPPSAGFNLVSFNFTDVSNFFARAFSGSLAQNTPDTNNNVKYVERRYRNIAGSLTKWGAGGDPWRQADLHWNGSAWANCAINFENTSGVRDAQGNSAYNYCDSYETGKSNRATFNIAGKTMADVYTQVRTAGYTNLTIADATLLGTTTFPTGSSLLYQTGTPLTTAIAYYPGSSNLVTQYSSAVTVGGTASAQAAGVGCNSTEFKNTNGTNSTTLEGLIGAMTGTPCVFGQGSFKYPAGTGPTFTSPDTVDEAWGNSTVGIGTLGTAPVGTGTAPGFYSGNTKLRVAFKGTGSNPVTYYACKERFNTGSARNCTVIGTGSYTIATLGDARVLTLNNAPTQASPLTFTKVFVERGGLIYSGYQNKPVVSNSARLNTIAATALLTQLGLTADDPSVPLALTAASYQGIWDLNLNGLVGGPTMTLSAAGSWSCFSDRALLTPFTCTLTIDPSTGAVTETAGTGSMLGTVNFLTGTASGTYIDPTLAPTTGTFVAQRR
ncbi:MAG: hypothetical protein Q7T78_16245 [Rhodoferax sp.]|nr:hypothetical protein [Rhodoferax sp.]